MQPSARLLSATAEKRNENEAGVTQDLLHRVPLEKLNGALAGAPSQDIQTWNQLPVRSSIQWQQDLRKFLSTHNPGLQIILDIPTSTPAPLGTPSSRYTFTIVDSLISPPGNKCSTGVLIIPQGREGEYIFGHLDGQRGLLQQHHYYRLIFVTLNRMHTFVSLTAVQDEIRPYCMSCMPSNAITPIPFIGIGDDVGERIVRSDSVMKDGSNHCIVEDVRVDERWHRRLIFNRTTLTQSEVRLVLSSNSATTVAKSKNIKDKRKGTSEIKPTSKDVKVMIDSAYLPCLYQHTMITAFSLLPTQTPVNVLLIGLGGGNLPMFLGNVFPGLHLVVVDIEPTLPEIAKEWFGYKDLPNMRTIIRDGVELLHSWAAEIRSNPSTTSIPKFDVIIIDCNSDDLSDGLSLPPRAFLTSQTLQAIHQLLNPESLFLLNLACRAPKLKQSILNDICGEFLSDVAQLRSSTDSIDSLSQSERKTEISAPDDSSSSSNFQPGHVFEFPVSAEDVNVIIAVRTSNIGPGNSLLSKSSFPHEASIKYLEEHLLTKSRAEKNRRALLNKLSNEQQQAIDPFNWDSEMELGHRLDGMLEWRHQGITGESGTISDSEISKIYTSSPVPQVHKAKKKTKKKK